MRLPTWCASRTGGIACFARERPTSRPTALRVITSADGKEWTSAALVTSTTADLRDAKMTITPDGRLMLSGAGALHDKTKATHQSMVWFSADGTNWSPPTNVADPDFWLWRITWHKDVAYGMGYGCKETNHWVRLYKSADGKRFDVLVPTLLDTGYVNESSLLFNKDDTCYCLLRRDGATDNTGLLGVSKPPYTKWEWKDLGAKIGGPHMIRIPDGRIVAAVRLYDGGRGRRSAGLIRRRARSASFKNFPPAAIPAMPDWCGTTTCCG